MRKSKGPEKGSRRPPKVAEKYRETRTYIPKAGVLFRLNRSILEALEALAEEDGRNRTNYLEKLIREDAKQKGIIINKDLDYEPEN